MAMPPTYPAYPSRLQVVDYLESYAARFDIRPIFNTTVSSIRRDGTQWCARTAQGPIAAPVVVVATGIADAPYRPSWPGIGGLSGPVIHSSEYRNPAPYRGKARAGGRLWQFRRRDRAGSGQRRRRCRSGGTRPGSDPAARSPGLSDSGMGDSVPAVAGAAGRFHQRADSAAGCRFDRKTGIAPCGQRAAPDGRARMGGCR